MAGEVPKKNTVTMAIISVSVFIFVDLWMNQSQQKVATNPDTEIINITTIRLLRRAELLEMAERMKVRTKRGKHIKLKHPDLR